jgi:hypothetical protein
MLNLRSHNLSWITERTVLCGLWLFLICCSKTSFSNIDSTKTKLTEQQKEQYDINDPRNPNCPCHKYQQLAEKEYQQLQNQNKQQPDRSTSYAGNSSGSAKRNKIKDLILKAKREFQEVFCRKKKIKTDQSTCFHWR